MRETILNELNLEPIMVKAMDKEEGYGWTLEFTKGVAEEYKKFLILCSEHPDVATVPSGLVDDFWHLHILDTMKYYEDCQNYLGYFLHHFPYFGMRGEQDASNLNQAWEETCRLYEGTFGKLPSELWAGSHRCPNCGRRCSGIKNPFSEKRPMLADLR